jgi:dethiobiotin synthetase
VTAHPTDSSAPASGISDALSQTNQRVVVVTGTSTGVGKTVATAALAVVTPGAVVVKPVQTGAQDGDSDAREVARLSGAPTHEWTVLEEPLAPETAARRQGVAIPTVAEHAARVGGLATGPVVLEGAGGLLVRLDASGGTLLDLALALVDAGHEVEVIVVCAAGLGTLNHTELTVRELRRAGREPTGLVVGAWPARPGPAETCNLEDLPRLTGVPVLAVIPEGAGALSAEVFAASAPEWFRGVAPAPVPAG